MLQVALDHDESFFDTPKGWKAIFLWVVDGFMLKDIDILQQFEFFKKSVFSKILPHVQNVILKHMTMLYN